MRFDTRIAESLKALQRLLANSPKESGFLWLINEVIPMRYI